MNKITTLITLLCFSIAFTSCSKDDDPIVEVAPSDGSTLTLQGIIGAEAGTSAGNSVFVDFSADQQISAARESWDLGFYSGAEFKVILNHSVGATAIATTATDLSQVTAADTVGLVSVLNLPAFQGQFSTLEPVDGNLATYLTGTAIQTISASDADNKVYIVNRGASGLLSGNRGWQKIRVIRSGNGYTLQYAKINETTFKTLTIPKNTALNFSYVSFVTGAVTVEPEKAAWDIEWTYTTYKANDGTKDIPYTFSDFVIINFAGGVTAAQVLTSTVSYTDFAEANLAGVTFLGTREVIGSNWRLTTPAASAGVLTDRFYLVKDASGNIYKLKFVSFHANDSGVRGKPVIEYKLVKRA
jgi:hypothetical protein